MDGSAALTDTKSPNHHNGHQHGSGARHDDHGTTTLYTTGDPRTQELAGNVPRTVTTGTLPGTLVMCTTAQETRRAQM